MEVVAPWSVPKRIAFRFGVVLAALYMVPLPLGLIPGTQSLAEAAQKPLAWLVVWFADTVLGVGEPAVEPTGAGDTLFGWVMMLVLVILAAIGCAVWSAIDRERTAYPRLAALAHVALRYLLAWTLFSYGFVKLSQFPTPSASRLDGTIGEMSPMGLLWTFMGYSTPYKVFAGICEIVPGILLLWRRTATLGALLAIAVLTNIVMLNMSYDVPVKLYSMQLVAIGLVIAAPQLRRVAAALLGHAVPEVPSRPRLSPKRERVRLAIKLAVVAMLAYQVFDQLTSNTRPAPNALDGIWIVETWRADGVEHPPRLDDAVRWRKLAINPRSVIIRLMTDERRGHGLEVDDQQHTMKVSRETDADVWRYVQRDAEHLAIDGTYRGQHVEVTLRRQPTGLLMSRGFHWIQEFPLNR
ncbi:MAG TPA: DoxX family protein [Kofleriaceae bacterium]|nr:DoxX family protein [Kofleriaceae bacterium]